MAVTRGTQITQAQMDALAALANTKLAALGSPAPFDFSGGVWLDEMDRLRAALNVAILAAEAPEAINAPQFCVSGPWAFWGDGQTLGSANADKNFNGYTNFKDATFYYRTDSSAFTLVAREWWGYNPASTALPNVLYSGSPVVAARQKIVIGGTEDGRFYCGKLAWGATAISGSADPVFTHSSTVPGVTWTQVNAGGGAGTLFAEIDAGGVDLSPGEYTFDVECDGDHRMSSGSAVVVAAIPGFSDPVSFAVAAAMAFDVVRGESADGVNAPEAVHGSTAISKLAAAELADGDYPSGIWLPVSDLSFTYPMKRGSRFSLLSTPGANGIFVGWTQPIQAAVVQNSLGGVLNFPYGDEKLQAEAPDPETPGIEPGEFGIGFRPPRWPCFRDTATLPSGGDWDAWEGKGWQIYSITARRKAVANASGILVAPNAPTEIPVQVGHMKGCTFTAGLTFAIAAGAAQSATQYVCWPVFTGTPLAYQCAEELFIAATACRAIVPWKFDTHMGFPVMAAHYNDVEAILNLL